MAQNRGRQKKLEKKRKTRDAKRRVGALAKVSVPNNVRGLVQLAARQPFGPAFLSHGWDDLEEPALVTVLVTRRLPDGTFLPAVALVDRTCLGVKNGFPSRPVSAAELPALVERIFAPHDGSVACDVATALSVVFHGIDYAATLGFHPHRDFPAALFAPRPAVLVETPWAHPAKPYYFCGPDDNQPAILAQLDRVVGIGNYHFLAGGPDLEGLFGESMDSEGDDDEDGDDEGDALEGAADPLLPE